MSELMKSKIFMRIVFLIFTISFFNITIASADVSNDFPYFCELSISFYPEDDGRSYEKFHRNDKRVRGITKIYEGEHPSHGSYKQLGVRLVSDVCYRNEATEVLYVDNPEDFWIKSANVEVKKFEYSLSEFILVFLDDFKTNEENDDCSDKWWTAFEDDQRVILKVADIYQGMTAHYSTAFAIVPEDIMLNGNWICS